MTTLTPFLLFDGNCAEAMAFYQSVLGGELSLTTLGETAMGNEAPLEQHHKVAYGHLVNGGIEFSAVDWMHQTRRPNVGNTVAVYLTDANAGELRRIFDGLSVGADPDLLDDLEVLPFGTYGHLVDRYGVGWFFRGDPDATPQEP
ncbi:MAG TPA: VOC family protein [Acidimicrobiales bacterium]|jgi:PhnB protein